jgi:hypothetical protein
MYSLKEHPVRMDVELSTSERSAHPLIQGHGLNGDPQVGIPSELKFYETLFE